MRNLTLAITLMIGVAAASGHASAQVAPPAKVCKNLLGKVVPCPAPKPAPTSSAAAAKPGLLSHVAGLGHPSAGAPPTPAPAVKPPVHAAANAPVMAKSSVGGSQTSRIGATAKCKDGTYWQSKSHSGACSRHNGVAVFY